MKIAQTTTVIHMNAIPGGGLTQTQTSMTTYVVTESG